MPGARDSRRPGVLVTVGDLVEDVVVWSRGAVQYATDNPSVVHRARGGSAANVAAFASDCVPARFIGCVGDDPVADMLTAELASHGVDVRVQRRERTGTIVVLVDPSGERTMYPDRAAAAALAEVPTEWLEAAAFLHAPSYCFAAEPTATSVLRLIKRAGQAGIPVSIDASSTGMISEYGLARYLDLLDELRPAVFFANAREARLLDVTRPQFGPTMTVVKNGARSTTITSPGGSAQIVPVPPAPAVRDSTGAGDAFAAGFLSALMSGATPAEAAGAGHRRARSVLFSPGATARNASARLTRSSELMSITPGQAAVRVSSAVSSALSAGRPVVALESTIFSSLGLPAPANGEVLRRCLAAVRGGGAEPAVTAILDGQARVGLESGEEERILTGSRKVAERDIAVAVAQAAEVGVTTVSASVALAHAAGVQVFATGGIGGVHRGAEVSGDISADLDALANHPVVTVCAGAKAFLDLRRTLEYLETAGVPVLGWQHDWFPAFYLRSSGIPVPHRAETARLVADVLRGRMRERTGVLLTVPIPPADELDPVALSDALAGALAACEAEHITGAAVTPFVLARIEQQTAGASVPANLALAENNARVAAAVAAAVLDS